MENSNENNSEKKLIIHRIFDAPRELLWKAWTDPEITKKWFGPRTYTIPFNSIDLRLGGKNITCMRSPEGKDMWSVGEYRELIPNERIVITDSFADENGNIVSASDYGMDPAFPLESIVVITFKDLDGKTDFNMNYIDGTSPIPEKDLIDMTAGWNESFDKLDEYLAQVSNK